MIAPPTIFAVITAITTTTNVENIFSAVIVKIKTQMPPLLSVSYIGNRLTGL